MTRDSLVDALMGKKVRGAQLKKNRHKHGEAFAVMAYQCMKCGYVEHIWNSRDGVSPFAVDCPLCDSDAVHVVWQLDWYRPKHRPLVGERVFVTLTAEVAREFVPRLIQRAKEAGFPFPGTEDDMVAEIMAGLSHDDEPALVTVTESMAIERGWLPKPASIPLGPSEQDTRGGEASGAERKAEPGAGQPEIRNGS